MKKIIFFSIFLIFSVFLMNQQTFAETEEEERKELVENAANSLKRENTHSDTTVIDERSDEKEVKKKLGKLKKFLPTEEDLDKITLRTVWRYVDKQSDKNEEFKLKEFKL